MTSLTFAQINTLAAANAVVEHQEPMPISLDRVVVTPRGAAVVAIIRFERILPEIPAEDRAVALRSLHEHQLDAMDLDDEDRAYLAPYLDDLAAACA